MIRKEGKARWIYTCELCSESVTAADQFRAIEYRQWHERSYAHSGRAVSIAMQSLVDVFAEALKPVLDAVSSFAPAFTPPPNRPHDPTLLRDRRKWGGR